MVSSLKVEPTKISYKWFHVWKKAADPNFPVLQISKPMKGPRSKGNAVLVVSSNKRSGELAHQVCLFACVITGSPCFVFCHAPLTGINLAT